MNKIKTNSSIHYGCILLLLVVISGCKKANEEEVRLDPSVMWKIFPDTTLSTFLSGLNARGLSRDLNNIGKTYTVFAPLNSGFEAFLSDTTSYKHEGFNSYQQLALDAEVLDSLIKYHIIDGKKIESADFTTTSSFITRQGGAISVSLATGKIVLNKKNPLPPERSSQNGATVVEQRLAPHGAVYILDSVLVPPTLNLKSLRQTLKTVPELSAFYEAVERASNIQPVREPNTGTGNNQALVDQSKTIKAYFNGSNSIRTVFAPTNEAFNQYFNSTTVTPGTGAPIANPDKGKNVNTMVDQRLVNLVLFHIHQATARRLQSSFNTNTNNPTLLNKSGIQQVLISASPFVFGTANVTKADVRTFRGLLHIVDKVNTPVAGY